MNSSHLMHFLTTFVSAMLVGCTSFCTKVNYTRLTYVSLFPRQCTWNSSLTYNFLACLKRFIARRGKPSSVWSYHGTNFVGTNLVLKKLYALLLSKSYLYLLPEFIPERAPHFGGLREAAVKSFKTHLFRVVRNVLTQMKACLNSRPLGTGYLTSQ